MSLVDFNYDNMDCPSLTYNTFDNFRIYGPKPLSDNSLSLLISYERTFVYVCNQNYLVTYSSDYKNLITPKYLSKYHFFSRQMTKINTEGLSRTLIQVTMILDGDNLIIHGKTDFNSQFITLKGNLLEDTVHFVKIATMPIKFFTGFDQTICMHNQQLYAIEGYDSECHLFVFKLNSIENKWKLLRKGNSYFRPLPMLYTSQRAVSHNNKLYLINDKTVSQLREQIVHTSWNIEEFNLQTKQWRHLECTIPRGIISYFFNNPTKILHNGWMQSPIQTQFLYMSANYTDDGNGNWNLYDIWRLDLNTLSWKCISLDVPKIFSPKTDLPNNRKVFYQYNSRAIDDCIKPNTIPSLMSLAWDATCDLYIGAFSKMSITELSRMGIPENYINKIKGLRFA